MKWGRYRPTTLTPKARAQRLFNRITEKCYDLHNMYGKGCSKCGYQTQCTRLAAAGIRVPDETNYAQRSKADRQKITEVFAILDKRAVAK